MSDNFHSVRTIFAAEAHHHQLHRMLYAQVAIWNNSRSFWRGRKRAVFTSMEKMWQFQRLFASFEKQFEEAWRWNILFDIEEGREAQANGIKFTTWIFEIARTSEHEYMRGTSHWNHNWEVLVWYIIFLASCHPFWWIQSKTVSQNHVPWLSNWCWGNILCYLLPTAYKCVFSCMQGF